METIREGQEGTKKIRRGSWVLVYDHEGSIWVKVIYSVAGPKGQHFLGRSTQEEPAELYLKDLITCVAKLPDDEEKIRELQDKYFWKKKNTKNRKL